jgi:hypothetical protein
MSESTNWAGIGEWVDEDSPENIARDVLNIGRIETASARRQAWVSLR